VPARENCSTLTLTGADPSKQGKETRADVSLLAARQQEAVYRPYQQRSGDLRRAILTGTIRPVYGYVFIRLDTTLSIGK